MQPNSLAVLGLGAIGGSVAWQARLAGVPRVIGWSRERTEGLEALKAGALSDLADSAEQAVAAADLVVLATPPRATLELMEALGPRLSPRALLTDVASVKAPVVAQAVRLGLTERFAGSHPFTGTHETGWRAARPDRLRGALVYVTPTDPVAGEFASRQIQGFWRDVLEAHPVLIDAAGHDRQLAWTSHLPQAVASALAATLAGRGLNAPAFGAGARDTVRLAASGPELWSEIFLQNAPALLEALAGFEGTLARLRTLVAAGDATALATFLSEGQEFKRMLDR